MTKRYLTLAVAAALCLIGRAASAQSANLDPSAPSWLTWRGPDRNGVIADAAWNPKAVANPKVVWKAKVGAGYSSVCIVGGYVFTAGMKDFSTEAVVCLDGKNGAVVWTFSHPSAYVEYQGSRAVPVYSDGRLYIMSLTGHAYCLDAKTGKKIWDTDIAGKTGARRPQWAFSSSALLEGDLAIFNVCKAGVALDKASGKIVWKSAPDASGYATPVAFDYDGARYLAILGSRTLSIVEAQTGKELTSVPWVTDYDVNVGDPVVVGNTIFVGTDYGTGCALLRLESGKLSKVWQNSSVLPHFCSAVYLDGYYYTNSGFAGGGFGTFFCLDGKTGKATWSQDLGVGSLIAAGDNLVISTETGDLIIAKASAKGYSEVARASRVVSRLCWTAPVLVGGRIYLRSSSGDLACLDVSK
jgi:outer membrane protein assembly factor BamB